MNKKKIKMLKFGSHAHPLSISVVRDDPDNGDALGLSQDALHTFRDELIDSLIKSLKVAFEEKRILPRAITVNGVIIVHGRIMDKDEVQS